ncbi:MAG: FAD-binding oxidoreductase [Proteobacteria bacterium]|nr:FAD-binding oxidoreductase [Pseudomonadota bacterium]
MPAAPERAVPERLIAALREALGPAGVIEDAASIAPYMRDARGLFTGRSPVVVRPGSTAEAAAAVRLCAEARVPMVPQGGNTGLVGGSVPDESGGQVLISLSRLNRVRAIDPVNLTLTAEAGCVLAQVRSAAAEAGRFFALSLASEGTAQIGGNLSTNAGGNTTVRYGNAREQVLGLEVVLPDGRVWDGLRALRKDNTGYDLKHLFIGAEGTLGIITAAVLRLYPAARDTAVAMAAVRDPRAAVALLAELQAEHAEVVTSFEYLPRIGVEFVLRHAPASRDPFARAYRHYALIELSSSRPGAALRGALEQALARGLERGQVLDAVIAGSEAQAQALWRLREEMSDAQKPEGGSIKNDVSVPVSRVAEFLETATERVERELPGIRVVAFGHLGDGNIHFNLSQPEGADRETFLARWDHFADMVNDIVAGFGGSFSAEHGIGRLKREVLARYRSPVELDLMRRIKAAIDPHNLMNPGKIL